MSPRILVLGTSPSPVTEHVTQQLEQFFAPDLRASALEGTTLPAALQTPQEALAATTNSLRADISQRTFIRGLEATPAPSFDTLGWNLDVAANVGATVIAIVDATGMGQDLIDQEIAVLLRRASQHHAAVGGIILAGAAGLDVSSAVPVIDVPLTATDFEALQIEEPTATTPLMFQGDLLARARADRRTIVLPEPEDDRILRATAELLSAEVADIVLIGDAAQINADAERLELDLAAARIVSPHDPELVEKYAEEFAQLRAKKGVTIEEAREKVQDVTYFATMMVQMGDADGMVSGAAHTTANTIVPAFQIIKTAPGASIVSSAFLMLMADEVLVMGDCAVNPNPTPEQLAAIAISSAQTARQFGLDPRVAMLSYSTGSSGSGVDVEAVAQATALVNEQAPDLLVEGPIQYDAAVDPAVGASKAPDSPVAGQANVLVFPTLNAGNIAYKAVQRSAGAVAVGPILQGLRRPVNDLSRGALVEDIVNTVAITAVQAQSEGSN